MDKMKLSKEITFVASENIKEQKYWSNKFSGDIVKSQFPYDNIELLNKQKKYEKIYFTFPSTVNKLVNKIAGDSDARLLMILTAGINILIDKYCGNKDIIIGIPIEKQKVEGNFINKILPIRNTVHDNDSFKDFLLKARQSVIEATENQNYPIEALLYDLKFDNNGHDFPLFDVAILLENMHNEDYLNDISLNTIFSFIRKENSIEGNVKYNSNLFHKNTIEQIIKHFNILLENVLSDVNQKLVDIDIIQEEEKKDIIFNFNNTASTYPRKTFQELFQEQVEKTPENIALKYEEKKITYKELNQRANVLARKLIEMNVSPNSVICLMGVRNIEMVIAILASLKSGAAYLPINAKDPSDRLKYIIQDSNSQLLLTQKHVIKNNSELKNSICNDNIIYIDDLLEMDLTNHDTSTPGIYSKPEDMAYVIYTSGTTGKPKGVMIQHKAMINYLTWAAKKYVKNEKVDFPFYTSFSFDMTITTIFTPLITGNSVLIYGGDEKEFILEKVIKDNQAGVLKATPSHLKMLIDNKDLFLNYNQNGNKLKIKRVIVGGEELDTQVAKDIENVFKNNIEIYNEYGPTEATVGCMIHKFNPDKDLKATVPIGVPADNVQIYILDRNLKPVPIGVTGELYISGDGLSKGYLHKPELSASKFINNPFIPGTKMYKSGDLARMNKNKIIEFLGRIDHQVKIRGFRVELGEIESKIIEYQRMHYSKYGQNKAIKETWDLISVKRCKKCLVSEDYVGINIGHDGICDVCKEYDKYKKQADQYFKTPEDFIKVAEKANKTKKSEYDCLLLYSGGKDSSYVLHKLVEMGLKVLAFTYDNGYVSETAFNNIKRTTSLLNVDLLVVDSEYMNEVFVESLRTEHNVCNGCFKGVNTIGTKIASDYNINLVVSGLSRGQIFDIKLQGLFKLGIFDYDTINERLNLFRKEYHSMKNKTSRLLNVEITEEMVDNIYFEDYFEYDNISVSEIFEYLKQKDKGWCRPDDTGLSSSNCMINDIGIYVHLKDTGYHFYEAQLSWDVRLGTLTREEGLEEITGFKIHPDTINILSDIGYFKEPSGAIVVDKEDKKGDKYLCAYVIGEKDFKPDDLKAYLTNILPDYMIPSRIIPIDVIPLTASGKVDRKALPDADLNIEVEYVPPQNELQRKVAMIWGEILDTEFDKIGIDYNFFELGGHSLKATILVTKILKEFNIKIPLTEVFKFPTVRKLSDCISILTNKNDTENEQKEGMKKIVI